MENKVFKAIKILSILGIILALYLLFEQITQTTIRPCTINSTINCDAIISGEVAQTLGLPTPLYGLVGYIVILFAAFRKNKKLLLGTAFFGLIFCLWIGYREIFELKVICPVCIMCQIVIISIFGLSVKLIRQK